MRSIIDREIFAIGVLAVIALPGIALLIHAAVQARKGKVIAGVYSLLGAAGVIVLSVLTAMTVYDMGLGRSSCARNSCISNLRQIDGAKDTYLFEYGGDDESTITWAQVAIYIKDITNKCYCPVAPKAERHFSSNYIINTVDAYPECIVQPGTTSTPDHSLKFKA